MSMCTHPEMCSIPLFRCCTAPPLVFHLPFLRHSSLSIFAVFLPPLVGEEGIVRAREDDKGRITLSPFLREILTGVINTQPDRPTLHPNHLYSSSSCCCASSAGWKRWEKSLKIFISLHTGKQRHECGKHTALISHYN